MPYMHNNKIKFFHYKMLIKLLKDENNFPQNVRKQHKNLMSLTQHTLS